MIFSMFANRLRHRMLRWNADAHIPMILPQMPFHNLAFLFPVSYCFTADQII
jgi:hypothetical protein